MTNRKPSIRELLMLFVPSFRREDRVQAFHAILFWFNASMAVTNLVLGNPAWIIVVNLSVSAILAATLFLPLLLHESFEWKQSWLKKYN